MSEETQTHSPEEQHKQLVFNGINARTGNYLTPTLTVDDLAGFAQGKSLEEIRQAESDDIDSRIQDLADPALKQLIRKLVLAGHSGDVSLRDLVEQIEQGEPTEQDAALEEFAGRLDLKSAKGFPLIAGKDPSDLRQTGWGVIFARTIDPEVRTALQPLLNFRQRQVLEENDAANKHDLYKEFTYRGEDAIGFLQKYGVGPGPVDPDMGVPYYLLLVGDPEQIPYHFQYQLDIQFAVGRIWFDTVEEYHQYALNVIYAESGAFILPRTAVFFGVSNDDDQATQLSAEYLVKPLATKMQQIIAQDQADLKQGKKSPEQAFPSWDIKTLIGKHQATRQNLITLLKMKPPALLFTASHGLGFENGDPEQLDYQGALLCQEWPGPFVGTTPIPKEHYFSADDVSDDMVLTGTIAFFFACYGAGTPEYDEFAQQKGKRDPIAPRPFLARLPRKLLSHPKGGALAVIGHVERAWGYSFYWGRAGEQIQVFENAFREMMPLQGKRLGFAYEQFNIRYAQLAAELAAKLELVHWPTPKNPKPSNAELAEKWTASNDARGYVIIGDPAVRLPVGNGSTVEGKREIDAAALQTIMQETAAFLQQSTTAPTDVGTRGGFDVAAMVEEQPRATAPVDASTRDFGFLGRDRQKEEEEEQELEKARSGLRETIIEIADQLGESLKKAIDDATTLEVKTYVSRDLNKVRPQGREFVGGDVQLRAMTRINLDGDTLLVLPQHEDGDIDREIWEIHSDMVKRAQENRNELIKTMSSAVAGLIESLKVL